MAGHKGVLKTEDLLKHQFWWPQMSRDTRQYVLGCEICARGKSDRQLPKGLLQPLPSPPGPCHTVSLDLIVDLTSSQGFNTILVCVDTFTKMAHFIPHKGTPTAKQLSNLFNQNIIRLHGIPQVLVTDRGSQFLSHFWKAYT